MKKIRSVKEEGGFVLLEPNHARVLRLKVGDVVKVLLTDGGFAIAELVDESEMKARIVQLVPPIERNSEIYAALSLLKRQRTETAVEFLSQLGVKKIIPVVTERSEVVPSKDKEVKIRERLVRLSREAARISGVRPPEIVEVLDVRKLPNVLDREGVRERVVFWESSENTFSPAKLVGRKIVVLVGPEGGFSEREIRFLRDVGFVDYNAGERIMKAEFFPLYIFSVLDFLLG